MADTLVQSPATVISDTGSNLSRSSSSLASRTSNESNKVRTTRGTKRHSSKPVSKSHTRDPSLTSFPTFSVGSEGQQTPSSLYPSRVSRTTSQRVRDRKATLAGLTSASPLSERQNALFDDSPRSSFDIPGSLHLATDEHIERTIVKTGAVKLIRQYASDLAQRDAELSALRIRADNRERELKRLLREADIPSAEIEKRLLRLEKPELSTAGDEGGSFSKRASAASLDGLISEALSEELELVRTEDSQNSELATGLTIPSRQSLAATTLRRINSSNTGSNKTSRNPSRANSVISQDGQDADATVRPRVASSNPGRLAGLQTLFQPPTQSSSYFIGGSNKTIKKPKAVDELSVKSNNSGKSFSSWTRIFGGAAQPARSRASSLDQSRKPAAPDEESAVQSLAKVRTNPGKPRPISVSGSQGQRPTAKRTPTVSRLSTSPNHVRKDSNASNLPPTVELDSMIESSQLPPTMSSHNPEGLLTDPYGFIYDRKRKRSHLQSQQTTKQSTASASLKAIETATEGEPVNRPTTPISMDEDSPKKSWQEYLTPTPAIGKGRPRELLSHTPSAGAVVTVNSIEATGTITPPRAREATISVSTQKAMPTVSAMTEPQSSAINVMSSGFGHESESDADLAASKILLEQLTELHEALQTERTIKWNDFLRRVRTERSHNTERAIHNTPEAELVNGELVGIATLGRSSKTKGKYMHFKSLVLSGIPVSLRPKIWAECSGATQMRIPGYYEDLVSRCEQGNELDDEISHQIQADVRRTLRDNIFFRSPTGRGARALEELLRAYSLHNPIIGYCQGMNLVTASLLLICVTPEDCFWLLVAIIDHILPSGYFDQSLLVARADQAVLRQYVAEVLPKLDAKLQDLEVELEACTFHWFLSLYSGVLTGGEALYRIWDVVLCLNSSDAMPNALASQPRNLGVDVSVLTGGLASPSTPTTPAIPISSNDLADSLNSHDGTSSPFLFQLGLALFKLNEAAILALDSPAQVYTYLNHNMTAHNITIDALVAASEGLRTKVRRQDVLERRKAAMKSMV